MSILKKLKAQKLDVIMYDTRNQLGEEAAKEASKKIIELLSQKDELNIVFASAPSQQEFIESIMKNKEIQWARINAFHMDEYIGLNLDAPQGFGNFLNERIFGHLNFKSVNYINGNAEDIDLECKRYSKILYDNPTDIVFMGIGENGHIAFNDPHVAFFNDKDIVKVVELDLECRNQQVNDGCFNTIDEVPTHAITLTIPTLIGAKYIFCMVPGQTKAEAVFKTVTGEITEECPASILKKHNNAKLYIDANSGSKLL